MNSEFGSTLSVSLSVSLCHHPISSTPPFPLNVVVVCFCFFWKQQRKENLFHLELGVMIHLVQGKRCLELPSPRWAGFQQQLLPLPQHLLPGPP